MQYKTISNRFTKKYKTKHPFVNAAMAFVGSTADLPAAVIKAGGMGTFAIGALTPESVRAEVDTLRRNSINEPLNMNAIVPFTTEQHIDLLCELKPQVVSFHWGPVNIGWITKLHEAKIEVWQQIGSAEEAEQAVLAGVDAVIVQGLEAGGHNLSTLPLFVLLPEVVRSVAPVMVVAGGGISQGSQVAAALALGADAVWVGSRLIASKEADAHPVYKQRIVDTVSGSDTALTPIFGRETPDFNPMRTLSNSLTQRWVETETHSLRLDSVELYRQELPVKGAATEKEEAVNVSSGVLLEKPGVGLMDSVEAVENIVTTIVSDDKHQESCLSEAQPLGSTKLNGQMIPVDQFSSFPPIKETTGDVYSMALCCGQGVGLIDSIDGVEEIITTMMNDACDVLQQSTVKIDSLSREP